MGVPRQSSRKLTLTLTLLQLVLLLLVLLLLFAQAVEAEAGGATATRAAVEIVAQLQRREQRLVSKVGKLSLGVCHQ